MPKYEGNDQPAEPPGLWSGLVSRWWRDCTPQYVTGSPCTPPTPKEECPPCSKEDDCKPCDPPSEHHCRHCKPK